MMSIEYVVMLFYCIAIVILMLFKALFDSNLKSYPKKLLISALTAEILMLLAEALGTLMSLGKIKAPIMINTFDQFIFFLSQAATNFITFLLLAVITGYITPNNWKKAILFSIPAGILVLIAFLSMWTGWMFYIDDSGVYQKGPINVLQYIVVAFYLIFSGISGIVKFFMKKYYGVRRLYLNIFIYSLIPLFGVFFQDLFSYEFGQVYPLILASFTISTLVIYVQLLQNQVQTDSLTEIPNRAKFMRFLNLKMLHESNNLALFLLDINDFKLINDNFGHTEGDRVLKVLSNQLKQFSRDTGTFVARYAGDEFVVVAETSEENLDELQELLKTHIKVANEVLADNRYVLSVAIGYAKYEESLLNVKDFIDKADMEMYKDKELYHKMKASA